jgi:hypothetical protein
VKGRSQAPVRRSTTATQCVRVISDLKREVSSETSGIIVYKSDDFPRYVDQMRTVFSRKFNVL